MSISALFKFAGVAINLKPYKGNYSLTTVQPRDIPTDALIQEWYFKIKTPSWQWAYGILSAYGIRPEELVLLEFDAMPVLIVRGDKSLSSDRRVYPIYPEWVDLFNLKNPILPNCKDLGKQTCKQFQRYKIPFSPLYLEEEQRLKSLIKKLSRGNSHSPLQNLNFLGKGQSPRACPVTLAARDSSSASCVISVPKKGGALRCLSLCGFLI